jgi:hypothetical protein
MPRDVSASNDTTWGGITPLLQEDTAVRDNGGYHCAAARRAAATAEAMGQDGRRVWRLALQNLATVIDLRYVLIRPTTGVIITVTIAGADPDCAAARRISVITADPDPATVDPLVVAGDPDGSAIGARPGMLDDDGRRRDTNLDAHIDGGGGLGGTDKHHGNGGKCQQSHAKRSDFHSPLLD